MDGLLTDYEQEPAAELVQTSGWPPDRVRVELEELPVRRPGGAPSSVRVEVSGLSAQEVIEVLRATLEALGWPQPYMDPAIPALPTD